MTLEELNDPRLFPRPPARLTVCASGARHVVTLIKDITLVHRPPSIAAKNHLLLDVDDIAEPIEGYVAPGEEHVGDLIRFARAWPLKAARGALGYAGIQPLDREAFVTACVVNPQRDEAQIARAIRDASPTAMPNIRIVTLADRLLGRDGRMVAAVRGMGPGVMV